MDASKEGNYFSIIPSKYTFIAIVKTLWKKKRHYDKTSNRNISVLKVSCIYISNNVKYLNITITVVWKCMEYFAKL